MLGRLRRELCFDIRERLHPPIGTRRTVQGCERTHDAFLSQGREEPLEFRCLLRSMTTGRYRINLEVADENAR